MRNFAWFWLKPLLFIQKSCLSPLEMAHTVLEKIILWRKLGAELTMESISNDELAPMEIEKKNQNPGSRFGATS